MRILVITMIAFFLNACASSKYQKDIPTGEWKPVNSEYDHLTREERVEIGRLPR